LINVSFWRTERLAYFNHSYRKNYHLVVEDVSGNAAEKLTKFKQENFRCLDELAERLAEFYSIDDDFSFVDQNNGFTFVDWSDEGETNIYYIAEQYEFIRGGPLPRKEYIDLFNRVGLRLFLD